MAISGGCLCGKVRYESDADPSATRMCWCRVCQHIASGSATVNTLVPVESVTITGGIKWFEMVADSGNIVHRGFCPECGTQMFSKSISEPTHPIRVRVGTLDDPGIVAPQAIIWTDSAPAWVTLDPALPHFPKGPPAASPAPQPEPSKG